MFLRKGKFEDSENIKSLWKSCFGDTDEYIDLFLKNRFDPDFTVILEKNSDVIGMAHLLPCTINPSQKALYWYAVCIREDMRNQGLFKFLVKNVLEEAQKSGYANLCVPVPGLEKVYQKLGFTNKFTASDYQYEKGKQDNNTQKIEIQKAEPSDFLQIFPMNGGVEWKISAIDYAFLENSFCKGHQLKLISDGNILPFFAINRGSYFQIDYHNIEKQEFDKYIDSVFDYLKCNKILFRCSGSDQIIGLSDSNLVDNKSKISMILG